MPGAVACRGEDGQRLVNIIAASSLSRNTLNGWARARDVQLVPVRVCRDVKNRVQASVSGQLGQLHAAVASDPLISAYLSRSGQNASNVFAVQQQGNQLVVYTY
ncbi:hypothetical protein EMQ25_03825 [Arsenicitalea aurantiaca]|uniref:Uncharacterized protein n=2 Tax=Arsenicitalea aurantiaca TaxID=1783274 RepID=A0A433XLY3_9HYPH|nr:hypothetical protein EMQ25_03825 [Arsenicitalea aurantiaca]